MIKPLSADNFMSRLLGRLAAAVLRHPRWFLWPQVGCWCCACFTPSAF
jgi:hypothetical protein